jgi:cytochrome c biogenesis protein CcmG, thiol:disulfide interchange protein DsbE
MSTPNGSIDPPASGARSSTSSALEDETAAQGAEQLEYASRPTTTIRNGSSIKVIASSIAVVLAVFIGVLATRKTHSNDRASRVLGQAAPQITGISLLDGKPFNLQAQQGKFVVVNYFATWCPPCVIEHPELVKFSKAHPEVGMVSVVFQDNVDGVRKFFAKRGGSWPVIDSERAAVDFGVRGVPETYLISPAGQLIFQTNGGVTQKALEKAITRNSSAATGPATTATVPIQ